MSRAGLAAMAVAVCAAVASCASVPASGGISIGDLQGGSVQGQTGIQVVPVPPGRNWNPQEIVRGFLAASASFTRHHAVARDYLTRGFAKSWHPGWGATVVDGPHVLLSPLPHNVVPTGGQATAAVVMKGKRFATLLTAGQDQAGSVVVAPASTQFRFSLVHQKGRWRIDGIDESVAGKPSKPAPKSLLLLSRSDFQRDYLARNIYFFPANSSANKLVPDPVYIPQTGLLSEVRGLVSALIQPRCRSRRESAANNCPTNPPGTSWLFGAAVTAFPTGVRTVRPVQILGGVKAIVDLGNTAAKISTAQRQRMAAQLAWSLTASPYGLQSGQIRSVVLKFAHQQMTATLQPRWVPRGQGSSLYYQVPGSGDRPAQVVLRSSGTHPFAMNLPKQVGGRSFTSMAVSPAPLGSGVLAGCIGKTLYLIPQTSVQVALPKRLPGQCTSLSWDNAGNLWIATTSGTYEMAGAGGSTQTSSTLVRVLIPPPGVKPVQVRVAPDGVRVAMIVPGGGTSKIMIAAISKNSRFTYIAQTSQMLRVGSDLAHPVALTWLDPDQLLVLARRPSGHAEIFEVPLNGEASTEVPTPSGVTSLSATWPDAGKSPRVVIGVGRTSPSIEASRGPLINPDWQALGTGLTPVYPG